MFLLLFACTSSNLGTSETDCNGALRFCERPFDQVAVVGTHNSMSSAEDDWLGPNQNLNILSQLALGVRALNLDIYEEDGVLLTCHGYCSLGSRPLDEALAELRAWLDDNPNQVLSLTFQSAVSAEQVAASFEAADLTRLSFEHIREQPWPTLAQMIQDDTRLVVWTDHEGGDPAWYADILKHVWETSYAYRAVEDFDCSFRRGREDQSYVILAHFLTNPIASQDLAAQANAGPVLRERVAGCEAIGRRPNLVLVDFVDIGDVFDVVAEVNESWD